MEKHDEWFTARVASVEEIAEGVRQVIFDVGSNGELFDPGSHLNIKVVIDGQPAIRTYTCLPMPVGKMAIAVKLHPNSRGGSRFIWQLKPGDEVELTQADNRFPLSWRASHYLLLAGGIGVTPIYGMAESLATKGAPITMMYGGQNRASMAFADELESLLGDNLSMHFADDDQFIDIEAAIAALPEDGELYTCGPIGMLNAIKAAWAKSGRPISRLRLEVFGDNGKFAETAFEVEVLNENITVTVPPDKSLLQVLEESGVEMISDCRRGECGLCAVHIISHDSEIDHRDVFFSDEEKQESERMCACVSRQTGGHMKIDTGYRP
jgi:ferredoxin-NADP reductase